MAESSGVKSRGKLSGLCYENTVIDRKGRIRKIKPPAASGKKGMVLQQEYFNQQEQNNAASKNSKSNLNASASHQVDNKSFLERNSGLEEIILPPPWPYVSLDEQGNREERRERIWFEKSGENSSMEASVGVVSRNGEGSFQSEMENYRNLLRKNAQLNWKPQVIRKQKLERIVRNEVVWDRPRQIDINRDVYEVALETLEDTEEDEEEEEEEEEDEDAGASYSLRSESPDTLVERILENVDEEGNIMEFDGGGGRGGGRGEGEGGSISKRRSRNTKWTRPPKKSFSDEILERVPDSEKAVWGFSLPATKLNSKAEQTLKTNHQDGTQDLQHSGIAKGDLTSSKTSISNRETSPAGSSTIELERYIIELQKADQVTPELDSTFVPTTSAPHPSNTNTVTTPVSDPSRSSPGISEISSNHVVPAADTLSPVSVSMTTALGSERTPEEIFEEIMESIHDTEGEYDEPLFPNWPSLFPWKNSTNSEEHLRHRSIDYSVENDWMSLFYCSRVDDNSASMNQAVPETSPPQRRPSSSSLKESVGLLVNASLSTSASFSVKPSRNNTPRSSFRKTPGKSEKEETGDAVIHPTENQASSVSDGISGGSVSSADSAIISSSSSRLSSTNGEIEVDVQTDAQNISRSENTSSERLPDSTTSELENKKSDSRVESITIEPEQSLVNGADEKNLHDDNNDPTAFLFDALDSAFTRSVECNEARFILENHEEPKEELARNGGHIPHTPTEGFKIDGIFRQSSNDPVNQEHRGLSKTSVEHRRSFQNVDNTYRYDVYCPDQRNFDKEEFPDTVNYTELIYQDVQCQKNGATEVENLPQSAESKSEIAEAEVSGTAEEIEVIRKSGINDASLMNDDALRMNDDKSWMNDESRMNDDSSRMSGDASLVNDDASRMNDDESRMNGDASRMNDDASRMNDSSRMNDDASRMNGSIHVTGFNRDTESTMQGNEISAMTETGVQIKRRDNETKGYDLSDDQENSHLVQTNPDDPVSVLQVPKRNVQVLSEEVTSQTILLKIAWPAGRNRERSRERGKAQPYRELQLRRTIRMAEPNMGTTRMGELDIKVENDGHSTRTNHPYLESSTDKIPSQQPKDAQTPTADAGFHGNETTQKFPDVIANPEVNPSALLAISSRPDVVVEYENQEQSHNTETVSDTTVDVTQTDSVKVLLVPVETAYKVQDLKDLVAAVGKAILNDSKHIPAESNVRVTCEAIQSRSCASLQDDDVTVIRNTILDTYNPSNALALQTSPE